jgi:hypothetical protein
MLKYDGMDVDEWARWMERYNQERRDTEGVFHSVPFSHLPPVGPWWYREDMEDAYRRGVLDGVDAAEDWMLDLHRNGYVRPKEIVWLIERHRLGKLRHAQMGKQFWWDENIPAVKQESWAAVRRRILSRDGNKCVWCGSIKDLQVDHIRPVAIGGLPDDDNLRVLCRTCHKGRSDDD